MRIEIEISEQEAEQIARWYPPLTEGPYWNLAARMLNRVAVAVSDGEETPQ